MKKLYPLFFGFAAATQFSAQTGSVGINTSNPHSSAVLDLTSDSKGFLLPRLTTAAINTLAATASEGLVVYDKEQKKFLGWDGSKWQNLGYEEQNTAPYATNVTVSGTYQTGQLLTGNYTYTDADGNPESGTTFSWKRADDASGANTQTISSATAQTYTQQASDVGKFLQFCVTPQSNVGLSPGVQKCSAFGGPTTAIPANSAPTVSSISVSGSLNAGSTITGTYTYNDTESDAQNTTASGSSYQWKIADDASGTNLANATGAGNSGATNGTNKSYTLQSSEAGKYIKYCVKPVANTGTTTGAETCSSYSGPVLNVSTGLVAYEDFNATGYKSIASGGFGFTDSGTSTLVSTNGNTPNSPRYVTGNGLQVNNSNVTLTSGILDASGFSNNIEFSMRVASFSANSTNGADVGDSVTVAVDTGNGFSNEISLSGNSNMVWSFSNTNTATVAYDGDNTPLSATGPSSTLRITGIPNTVKRIRINIYNDNANEQWVIDDVKLTAQ